ncbi:MAG: GntR family transcriptional regulator [Ilumatobacter sp.]|jgi:DNA-binding GntR family transcriptional regulator|uniref:GntR family transcriptional regulator n=1 Tax=Ilumatobacter sp. TaxID=1967498 RepID=UPI00391C8BF0
MSGADSVAEGLMPIWLATLASGEVLPSEEALAKALGASRPAIREALIRMEANGLIRRHHGAGTFANPAALDAEVRLDNGPDFADSLRAVGFDVVVELLDASIVGLDEPTATSLKCDTGVRALRTSKRWRADGVVVVAAVDHVPLSHRADDTTALDLAMQPVREVAHLVGLGKVDWLCTWPSAAELDAAIAPTLEFDAGRAVLQMEQVGIERHGRRVFHALEHHRPGLVQYGLVRTVSD